MSIGGNLTRYSATGAKHQLRYMLLHWKTGIECQCELKWVNCTEISLHWDCITMLTNGEQDACCCTGTSQHWDWTSTNGEQVVYCCIDRTHHWDWMSTNGEQGTYCYIGRPDHWDWMSTSGEQGVSCCMGRARHWDWTSQGWTLLHWKSSSLVLNVIQWGMGYICCTGRSHHWDSTSPVGIEVHGEVIAVNMGQTPFPVTRVTNHSWGLNIHQWAYGIRERSTI